MIEGWHENGDPVAVGKAWVAMVVGERHGRVVVRLMGGGMLVARGSMTKVMAELREGETVMQ